MPRVLIVVEDKKDWKPYYPSEDVISADEYLFGADRNAPAGTRVINLCRSYKYLSLGYYCSLLAEARDHRVIPTVRTVNDLSRKAIYSLETEDLDELLHKQLTKAGTPTEDRFILDIFFGRTAKSDLRELGRQIFEIFTAPILKVEFRHQGKWRITSIRTDSVHHLGGNQEDAFAEALDKFSRHIWRKQRAKKPSRYDLAILHDPHEKLPPSDARALKNFVRVGKSMGVEVDLIERKDYARLAEYDALFIRETTAISDHTYRFAKKAEAEEMVVIDDPNSILRCTNKVYLADLLKTNNVPTPRSRILHKGTAPGSGGAGRGNGLPHGAEDPGRVVLPGCDPGGAARAAARRRRRTFQAIRPDPGPGVSLHRLRLAYRRAQSQTHIRLPVLHVQGPLADRGARAQGPIQGGRFQDLPHRRGAPGSREAGGEGRRADRRQPLWRGHQEERQPLRGHRGQ